MDKLSKLEARLEALERENTSLRGTGAVLDAPAVAIDRRSALRNLATAAVGGAGLFAATSTLKPTAANAVEPTYVVLDGANSGTGTTSIDSSSWYGPTLDLVNTAGPSPAANVWSYYANETDGSGFPSLVLGSGGPPGMYASRGGLMSAPFEEGGPAELYFFHSGNYLGDGGGDTNAGRVHTSDFSNYLDVAGPIQVMSTRSGPQTPTGTREPDGKVDSVHGTYTMDLVGSVEADCTAIFAAVTVTGPAKSGWATFWDSGPKPKAFSIWYDARTFATSQLVLIPLDDEKRFKFFVKPGSSCHIAMDLVGQVRTGVGLGGWHAGPGL